MGFMRSECPKCSSIWAVGTEEYDWQQCDCCGWPNSDEENDDFDEDDFGDENDYDEIPQ